MQLKSAAVAPALRALLENLIDYAGLFPPASLVMNASLQNYDAYGKGEYSWMLRSFVVGAADVDNIPSTLDGRLAILAEADSPRAASIESKGIVKSRHPVYCEVATGNLGELDDVKKSGCFAKIRTGGLKPDAIPSPAAVAAFIVACADRRLPFKATAGLHHPIRAQQALTYAPDAPRAVMHGFLNVLLASAFAWQGERNIEPIVAEMDASAFAFGDCASWRDKSISLEHIRDARLNFMHSIGSCSFDEPVQDLKALGLF